MISAFFIKLLRHYNHLLHRHPYKIQAVTSTALWFTGDCLCQTLVHASSSDKGGQERTPFRLDWNRVGLMAMYGCFVSAPCVAFWYSWLDRSVHSYFAKVHQTKTLPAWLQRRLLVESVQQQTQQTTTATFTRQPSSFWQRWNPRKPLTLQDARSIHGRVRLWKIIATKLAADCLLFDPFYLTLFFTSTSLMEGLNFSQIAQKLYTDLPHTYAVDVAVWAPIQTVNFRFVPVAYQALAVQTCNIGWNAYLSYVQHGAH